MDLDFEYDGLFFEAVQVNIVHIERIFALKHLIHVFLDSGFDEGFVEDVDDTGAILGFRRQNEDDEVSQLFGVSGSD